MNTFIEPEKIDVMCNHYREGSISIKGEGYQKYEEDDEKVKNHQSGWKKFTSRVKGVWEKVKPIVLGLTTFFTAAGALLKSVTKFATQCKNMKEAFA